MDLYNPGSDPSYESSGTNWQLVGILELPVGPESNIIVDAWLTQSLISLNLRPEFLKKVIQSATSAAARAGQAAVQIDFIFLHIFLPEKRLALGQTWGFFQTEKAEWLEEGKHSSGQEIALYLYPEG